MTTTTKESNKLTTAEARERLEAAVANLTSEDGWKDLLKMKALQHNYTFTNLLLAWSQNREMKMPLGGAKNFWKPLGRYPMKGTKAIRILAPMIVDKDKKDPTAGKIVVGFRAVPVFSADQTDGDPIPDLNAYITYELGEAPDGLYDTLIAHATAEGLTVEVKKLPDGVGGYLQEKKNYIALAEGSDAAMLVGTLFHELSHWHDRDNLSDYAWGGRPSAEVVAEASAYIVGMAAGMDMSGRSTGYVADWASPRHGGYEDAVAAIKKVAKRIDKAAGPLLAVVDAWKTRTEVAA